MKSYGHVGNVVECLTTYLETKPALCSGDGHLVLYHKPVKKTFLKLVQQYAPDSFWKSPLMHG
jgi:hypothetical protein